MIASESKQAGAFTVIATLFSCASLALVVFAATSAPRKPHSERSAQTATHEQNPADPSAVPVENQNKSPERDSSAAEHERQENGYLSQTIATWVQAVAAVASLALTIWLIVYSRKGWEAADKNAQAAKRNADAAKRAARLMRDQLDTNRRIERAYVSISHAPPGVLFSNHAVDRMKHGESVTERDAAIRVDITNFGNTPALVTAYAIHELTANARFGLMGPPVYNIDLVQRVRIHVPKGDVFNVTYRFSLHERLHQSIMNGTVLLCIIGFVDYIDRFGGHHRVGYARQFDPGIDVRDSALYWREEVGGRQSFDSEAYDERNNLPFVTEPGYNYDHERKHGEGNDWNEPAQ